MKTVMFLCWLFSPFAAFIAFFISMGIERFTVTLLVLIGGMVAFVGWSICECLDEISRKLSNWREEDHPPAPVPVSKRPPIKI